MIAVDDENMVLEHIEDRVLTITLNRPQRMNSITHEFSELLGDRFAAADQDDRVDVVIITGAGKAFCAGGDVGMMEEKQLAAPPGRADMPRVIGKAHHVSARLHLMSKPTIAMINGAAGGGGLALALACDMRVASAQATMSFAYTKIALSGDFGSNYFLTKILGYSKALEFALLSPKVKGEEALRIGLVNRCVPHEELEAETRRLALQMANGPRLTLAAIKRNIRAADELSYAEMAEFEADNFVTLRDTADHAEAIRAFIEKRPARYEGR